MSPFHTSPLSFLHPCLQHREGCFQVKVTFLVYTKDSSCQPAELRTDLVKLVPRAPHTRTGPFCHLGASSGTQDEAAHCSSVPISLYSTSSALFSPHFHPPRVSAPLGTSLSAPLPQPATKPNPRPVLCVLPPLLTPQPRRCPAGQMCPRTVSASKAHPKRFCPIQDSKNERNELQASANVRVTELGTAQGSRERFPEMRAVYKHLEEFILAKSDLTRR